MGTICSPNPSGTKTSSEVCNADWMASLPPHLHNVPLSNLAIPGDRAEELPWVSVILQFVKGIFSSPCPEQNFEQARGL